MGQSGTLPLAKKRSESRRFNTLVRMDDAIVERAKKVAALKGITLGEYFADITRSIVDRDLTREVRKLSKEQGADE